MTKGFTINDTLELCLNLLVIYTPCNNDLFMKHMHSLVVTDPSTPHSDYSSEFYSLLRR